MPTTNSPLLDYLSRCRELIDRVGQQQTQIEQAADWFASSILRGRVVHIFGAGHSRILVEEMWPRYGSFPGFNPIVELSLTFHNLVTGANGQRQAMFLENQTGLAERILRNYAIDSIDCGLVISSSGCTVVPIEVAQQLRRHGCKVVALVSRRHCEASASCHPEGIKLIDCADLTLDTGAPVGDAMLTLTGLATPVCPGSTIGGCLLINGIKAELAWRLVQAGQPPTVLTAASIAGAEESARLFESAYDQHSHLMARLYENVGRAHRT